MSCLWLSYAARSAQPLDEAVEPVREVSGEHTGEHPKPAVPSVPVTVPRSDRLAWPHRRDLEAGVLPSVRSIKRVQRVGTPRAQEIREHLEQVMAGQSPNGHREPQMVG